MNDCRNATCFLQALGQGELSRQPVWRMKFPQVAGKRELIHLLDLLQSARRLLECRLGRRYEGDRIQIRVGIILQVKILKAIIVLCCPGTHS